MVGPSGPGRQKPRRTAPREPGRSQKCVKGGIQKTMQKTMPKKSRKVCQKGAKMIPKRRPKWMKKRCDFPTCVFFVFTESITLKSFFYMSRGLNNCHKSVQNLCENGVGKRDAKSAQNIRDMYPRQRPKSYRNLQKRPKGGQRVRQEAPKVAWVAPKVCQRSLRPAYFLPTSLRSLSWSCPRHRFA